MNTGFIFVSPIFMKIQTIYLETRRLHKPYSHKLHTKETQFYFKGLGMFGVLVSKLEPQLSVLIWIKYA